MHTLMRGWRKTVGNLIEFKLPPEALLVLYACAGARGRERLATCDTCAYVYVIN